MANLVYKQQLPKITSVRFNAQQFYDFSHRVFDDAIVAANQFIAWEATVFAVHVYLDADPSLNIAGFYEKLASVQATKQQIVDIYNEALRLKSEWDSNLSVAEKYVQQLKSVLIYQPEISAKKNKELQEAAMYANCPEVFDFYTFCESTVTWMKAVLTAFDRKLDVVESANANLARQINVTELLSMRGLL